MRIAKKIMHTRLADPHVKPSEQSPYADHQWIAASKRYHQGLKAWARWNVAAGRAFDMTRPKWEGRRGRR